MLRETAREPQGRTLDVRIEEAGEWVRVLADALEDPSRWRNDAAVEADVYFVPAGAPGTALKPVAHETLEQKGPGRYETRFRAQKAGLYLVRARAGADLVSAGFVRNVASEAAGGRLDRALLERVCALTGGRVLGEGEGIVEDRPGRARWVELAPMLLGMLLLGFVADLAMRRWENVLGCLEWGR